MIVANVSGLRKNLRGIVEAVGLYNEVVAVTSEHGNVVFVSESDYNTMMETVHLLSSPGCRRRIGQSKGIRSF